MLATRPSAARSRVELGLREISPIGRAAVKRRSAKGDPAREAGDRARQEEAQFLVDESRQCGCGKRGWRAASFPVQESGLQRYKVVFLPGVEGLPRGVDNDLSGEDRILPGVENDPSGEDRFFPGVENDPRREGRNLPGVDDDPSGEDREVSGVPNDLCREDRSLSGEDFLARRVEERPRRN